MKKQAQKIIILSVVVCLMLAGCIALFIYVLIKGTDEVFGAILGLVLAGSLLLIFPFLVLNAMLGIKFSDAVESKDFEKAARIVRRCERLHRFLPFIGAEEKRIVLYGVRDDIPALKEAIAAYRRARSDRVSRFRIGETAYLCAMVALDEGRSVDAHAEYDLFLKFYLENTKRRFSVSGFVQSQANKKNHGMQAEVLQAVFTRLDGGYVAKPQFETVYPVVRRVLGRVFPQ